MFTIKLWPMTNRNRDKMKQQKRRKSPPQMLPRFDTNRSLVLSERTIRYITHSEFILSALLLDTLFLPFLHLPLSLYPSLPLYCYDMIDIKDLFIRFILFIYCYCCWNFNRIFWVLMLRVRNSTK